ncbi:MAG: AraC family transcriptional regulator [Gammaproteobacteria bacterium]|nr:AraC family transcriptional regulator [Gammaproteobacteria bacterium]
MQRYEANSADLAFPKVLACAATGLVEHIERNRGDVAEVFGRAGLAVEDLDSPVNELVLNQFCNLFDAAAKHTHNDNFGLEVGGAFKPEHLGPLGYAAICSPTLLAALANLVKYFPAHQGSTRFGLLEDGDVLWLCYQIDDRRIRRRRQDAELSLGIFWNIFKSALGDHWSPLEVRFEHPKPGDSDEHECIFGAPVVFHRRTNAFAFRRSDLEVKMPGQDPYLLSIISSFFESHYAFNQNPEDFAAAVKNQIKLHLGDQLPTVSGIAKILGLRDAAFHKALKNRGLLFSDILCAARRELALHYMKNADMPLTNIAYELGYSELSAFSRAFRAWTGMSPHRYRKTVMMKSSD